MLVLVQINEPIPTSIFANVASVSSSSVVTVNEDAIVTLTVDAVTLGGVEAVIVMLQSEVTIALHLAS